MLIGTPTSQLSNFHLGNYHPQLAHARPGHCASPKTRHPECATSALQRPGGKPLHLSVGGVEVSAAECEVRAASHRQWRKESRSICVDGGSVSWIQVCLSTSKGLSGAASPRVRRRSLCSPAFSADFPDLRLESNLAVDRSPEPRDESQPHEALRLGYLLTSDAAPPVLDGIKRSTAFR